MTQRTRSLPYALLSALMVLCGLILFAFGIWTILIPICILGLCLTIIGAFSFIFSLY